VWEEVVMIVVEAVSTFTLLSKLPFYGWFLALYAQEVMRIVEVVTCD
jgi:hypothetical protein